MSEKVKFYNISKLLKTNSRFMLCFGERSNGKTFQALLYGLERYLKYGVKIAIIRRYREDFKSKRGANAWNNLISDHNGHNHIKELTKGKYEAVKYNAGQWYLAHWDTDLQRYVTEPEPFAYSFALTEWEHDKGNSYPIGTIFLDEFMSSTYLPNETVAFFQVLSTIVRSRASIFGQPIQVIMAANSISRYCPYFEEFGIGEKVRSMQKGEIRIFKYGDSDLKVAVEYCDSPNINKPSDVFFAFENSKAVQMITKGTWLLDLYPHLTRKFEDKDIVFSYFVIFHENILQADIVIKDNEAFTFIHRKTTPIKYEDKDIIFTTDADQRANYFGRLTRPVTKAGKKIWYFFVNNKVFYSTNEIGDIMNHYIDWSNGVAS